MSSTGMTPSAPRSPDGLSSDSVAAESAPLPGTVSTWAQREIRQSVGLLAALGLCALLAWMCVFFVDESEYVYVLEFGKPVRLCADPGLQLKMPYQSLRRLDRRLQLLSPAGSQMLTRERPGQR